MQLQYSFWTFGLFIAAVFIPCEERAAPPPTQPPAPGGSAHASRKLSGGAHLHANLPLPSPFSAHIKNIFDEFILGWRLDKNSRDVFVFFRTGFPPYISAFFPLFWSTALRLGMKGSRVWKRVVVLFFMGKMFREIGLSTISWMNPIVKCVCDEWIVLGWNWMTNTFR